ncbi:MAG TPA: VOC family protein [Nitrospirota bacterium]|nr:VOC family protein [Nitrospirota bacterium]
MHKGKKSVIDRIDHLVLTVKNIETTCEFYSRAFGMQVVTFDGERKALFFGQQKINLHQEGKEYEPKAENPTPGSADLCFITAVPAVELVAYFDSLGIRVIEGPVRRIGALGTMISVYIRDPDMNLIEVSNYDNA